MSETRPDGVQDPTVAVDLERSPVFDSERVQELLEKAVDDAPFLEKALEAMKVEVKDEIVDALMDAVYSGDIPEVQLHSVIDVLCKIEEKKLKELRKIKGLLEDRNFDGFYEHLAIRKPDRKESDADSAATDAASISFNMAPNKIRMLKQIGKEFAQDQERLNKRLDRLSPKQALENKTTLELQREKHTKESASRLEASKSSTDKASQSSMDKKPTNEPKQTLSQIRQQEMRALVDQLIITTNPQQQQALLNRIGRMGARQQAISPLVQAQLQKCQMQVDISGLGINRRSAVVEQWRERNSQNNTGLLQTIDAITHYTDKYAQSHGPATPAQSAAPSPFNTTLAKG